MLKKRIIFTLLFHDNFFTLSRNFRLQKVGDINWLKNNYSFGETCEYVDEIIILNVKDNPSKQDNCKFITDINEFKKKIFVPLVLGGGIRKFSDAQYYFENGADKISLNSLVHLDKNEINKISKNFGAQSISIMVDYKKEIKNYFSFTNCGKTKSLKLENYFRVLNKINFGELILNSIDLDGTGFGYDKNILKLIPNNIRKSVLMMGGAGKPEHFFEILKENKISGAVTANLFNFLGSGLKKSRNYSIKKKLKLFEFTKLNEK